MHKHFDLVCISILTKADHNSIHKPKEQTALCGTAMIYFSECAFWERSAPAHIWLVLWAPIICGLLRESQQNDETRRDTVHLYWDVTLCMDK